MKYRPSYHFQVTVTMPCPCCQTFVNEKEIVERRRYIYGDGWTEITSCEPCFNKAVSEAQARADEQKSIGMDHFYG